MIIVLASFSNAFAQEQVGKPAFKEGDFWRYNVIERDFVGYSSAALRGAYEMTYLQGQVKVFMLNGDHKEEVAANPDSEIDQLLVLLGLSEKRHDLKFPLGPGKKWSYEYKHRPRGAQREQLRFVDINVSGVEQVTTTAGAFKAFKILKDERWAKGGRTGGGPWGRRSIYFYSPDIKSVVKSSMEAEGGARREIELIQFGSVR